MYQRADFSRARQLIGEKLSLKEFFKYSQSQKEQMGFFLNLFPRMS
jgi:hypothetical protein